MALTLFCYYAFAPRPTLDCHEYLHEHKSAFLSIGPWTTSRLSAKNHLFFHVSIWQYDKSTLRLNNQSNRGGVRLRT